MSITLQPQDLPGGGGEKRVNITLYTQNDLLHKRKKEKTISRLPKLYGVNEAGLCVET